MTLRRVSLPTLFAVALAAAGSGCKSGPTADGKRASGSRASGSRPSGSRNDESRGVLPPASERSERAFRVDTLVSQWDSAQADGRDEEATAFAEKIGAEVDADFPTFRAAARGDSDLRSQSLAVKALAFSKNPEALSLLVARLADPDADLVANALIAIKLRADPATPLPPLLTLLRSKALAVREFAPLALANVLLAREAAHMPLDPQVAPRAMGGLVGLLEDRDPVVRLHVAKAMGALRAPEANDFLVLLLKDDHVRIRIAAASALERIGDPRAFPKVVELLDAVDDAQKPLVREILVSYAARLQGSPLTAEQRTQLDVSPHAWDRWFASRTPQPPMRSGILTPPPREPAPAGAPGAAPPASGGAPPAPPPLPPPTSPRPTR